jgi:hypothetical protein
MIVKSYVSKDPLELNANFLHWGTGGNQLYFCNLCVITWPWLWNGDLTQQNILIVVMGLVNLRKVLFFEFVLPITLVDALPDP